MLKIFKIFITIVLSILLIIILLEVFLQRFGTNINQYFFNNNSLRNKSQYTIMCLGDSVTIGQYPIQLQKILDKKYPNKFSIIDCSVGGAYLETILASLDENINKYKPNITICMMGILNDFISENIDERSVHLKKNFFKTFKLFPLIKLYLKTIFKKELAFAKEIELNDTSFDFAIKLEEAGKYEEAANLLEKILKNNPNDEYSFMELMTLYIYYLNKDELYYNMAKYALDKKFNVGRGLYYEAIFKFCLNKNKKNIFVHYMNKLIDEDIDLFSTYAKYSLYYYIKNYITEKQRDKILEMITNDINDKNFGFLAIKALGQKDYINAQDCFNKAEEILLNFPNMETYNLYKQIIKKLIDNNIKVVCMQYPVRSIKPLQEQLKNEPYYNKLTFVSNEKIFKDSLMKKDYNDLFIDQFAGDFGHCTDLSNTLITENVVNTLEQMLDLKKS